MIVMIDGVRTSIGANRSMVCMVSYRATYRAAINSDGGLGPQDEMEVSRFRQLFMHPVETEAAPTATPVKPPAGPGSAPRVGSTWWHIQTSATIQVATIEYDRHNGDERIRFTDETGATDILLTKDFHDRYVPFNPDPPGEIGDEFIDSGGKLVIIKDLLIKEARAIIHLKGRPTATQVVTFQNLRTGYSKVNRRSAFERIMDDDL